MCTVTKGAKGFDWATVMYKIKSEKPRFIFFQINGHITRIIYSKYYTN